MDKILEKAKNELLQLYCLGKEIDESRLAIASLNSITSFDLNIEYFWHKSIKVPLNYSIDRCRSYMKNMAMIKEPFKEPTFNTPKPMEPTRPSTLSKHGKLAIALGGLASLIIGSTITVLAAIDEDIFLAIIFGIFSFFGLALLLWLLIKTSGDKRNLAEYDSKLKTYYKCRQTFEEKMKERNDAHAAYLKSIDEKYDKYIDEKSKYVIQALNAFKEERAKKIKALQEYKESIYEKIDLLRKTSEIPFHYTDSADKVAILLNIIFSKRADTLKELINTYEQDKNFKIIISEIKRSNETFIAAMYATNKNISNTTGALLSMSNVLDDRLVEIKEIAEAPITVQGYSFTYHY